MSNTTETPTTDYRRFADYHGLQRFWDNAKEYIRTLVTARKRGEVYVIDRSYAKLKQAFEKDPPAVPVLRVVDGNNSVQCKLHSYNNGIFKFRADPEFSEENGYMSNACIKEFTYGPSGFADVTRDLSVQQVSIDTIDIGD